MTGDVGGGYLGDSGRADAERRGGIHSLQLHALSEGVSTEGLLVLHTAGHSVRAQTHPKKGGKEGEIGKGRELERGEFVREREWERDGGRQGRLYLEELPSDVAALRLTNDPLSNLVPLGLTAQTTERWRTQQHPFSTGNTAHI